MRRIYILLMGAVLATAGLFAPPVLAQDTWGEPYTAPPAPDPGDDVLGMSNATVGPIWVRTDDPMSWDIEVSTVPLGDAVQLDPGTSQGIGLTPGQYQVVSDGAKIGDPIQIVGGREYALEFLHQPRPPDFTFEARLVEENETVILSWAGRNLTTTMAVSPTPSVTPPPAVRFVCSYHTDVVRVTPGTCPVCSAWLVERPVAEVDPPPAAVIAFQCRWHPEVISSGPTSCRICTSPLVQVMLDVR